MPRPKKNAVAFNAKIDADIMHRFEVYCKEAGQTKTLAFERIVSAYLDQYEEDKIRIENLKKK